MSEEKLMFTPKYKTGDILIVVGNESGHGFVTGQKVKLVELHEYFTKKEVWKCVSLNEHDNILWNVLPADLHVEKKFKKRKLI